MWYFTEEEKQIQKMCRDFARQELAPVAEKHDTEESFNMDAFKKMGEIGVLGITADPEYGGAGMGALSATIVMEEFGKACASSTLSYLAHSILCVNNIENNASKEQKEKYLPKLITGEHIGCMGMSEPEYGSDAVGIQTKAEKKDDHYLLNGTKMWITNAQYADIAYVYTRTGKERKNLSTFILEKDKGHFDFGSPIHKMGMRASPTGELIFDNAKVGLEQLVGNEGDSIYHMMKNLEIERITIAGISLGIAQACVDQCIKYANERSQFGKNIGEYQMIQKMIAEMATETEMMRNFLYNVAYRYDQGEKGPVVAAQVKLAIPKMATKIALDAIQLHGGYGYSREFPVERMMRDNKLNEIGAGTNEVMIMIIAKNLLKAAQA
ncbi:MULTISPECIES: acyl-CoA dehydrogenase family protein [unclassified Halobacteriovorax]|uniref:acyl-CoA dehydrogenase family protein n=1 Tax=unclassified Halobacteriovorax TaxID=2639665 RepID=UPI000EB6C004|nr:acyl-CoA dehydrogenase family protein [Halobacteriovorax sp. BALOs_7]AYF45481.1 acyl-CoA dehydrogenase, C-terminal domain protein [Halobacteriovorax sp. BALOs_7]